MSMRSLYDLRSMLCEELDEVAKKQELGAGDLEIVHKLTDTIKNIDKIEMMDGGYSQRMYLDDGYDHRNSYRGRHRDSMGRYSRDSAMDRMREQMQRMLDEADTEDLRRAIQNCMNHLDKA